MPWGISSLTRCEPALGLAYYSSTSASLNVVYRAMGLSLYNLFKAGLLVTNAAAILHPKRLLAKYQLAPGDQVEGMDPLKQQISGLLQAVSYLKVPLIILNLLVILIELVMG